jgi:uncharacterized protein DUF1844
MGPAEGEEATFKVTDRRRRSDEPAPTSAPPAAEPTPPPRPSRPVERNLVGLFMMLGSSVLMALGEAADPATGQHQRDLPAAAEIIDVLLLLRERTEGRRSAEETQVLEELLYDLQLRYVAATKQPG